MGLVVRHLESADPLQESGKPDCRPRKWASKPLPPAEFGRWRPKKAGQKRFRVASLSVALWQLIVDARSHSLLFLPVPSNRSKRKGLETVSAEPSLPAVTDALQVWICLMALCLQRFQSGFDSGDAGVSAFWKVVFPNPDDAPTDFSQCSIHQAIPELQILGVPGSALPILIFTLSGTRGSRNRRERHSQNR